MKNIYNIPAGLPFAHSLAQRLLEETKDNPQNLSSYLILLPTRRACRMLQETFLELNQNALLLPRLQPLGDVDEEELFISMIAGDVPLLLDVPPALSSLKRRALLAKLIGGWQDRTRNYEQALALAEALGTLLDQIYIQGLDFSNLHVLVPQEFAGHWQITTDFLKILSEHWPKILEEHGVIDGADRRNRLMRALASYWQNNPPGYPVIAAGSTGSLPATAELLGVIAQLPQGRVVLPGLDTEMDTQSWDLLGTSHPQMPLKKLLSGFKIERTDVTPWAEKICPILAGRRVLAREMMRPAETAQDWTNLKTDRDRRNNIKRGLENFSLLECVNENMEAQAIALLLRQTLALHKTAVLVTPDRALARRAIAACKAWNIEIDDSAGVSLDRTDVGIFMRLIMKALTESLSPVSLMALLHHPLARFGIAEKDRELQISFIDKSLRGPKPAPGLDGLRNRLGEDNPVCIILADIFDFGHGTDKEFSTWLDWHLQAAEKITGHPDHLWTNESGDAAAKFFASLRDEAHYFPVMNAAEYAATLEYLMKIAPPVRPTHNTHPRLKILGQLEARIIDADRIILAGLNEGTWPAAEDTDPWMSRPMRKQFGLPPPDEIISLAAHDFVQGFCGDEVILTRALRASGAPTVPARWLQRMNAVLEASGIDPASVRNSEIFGWLEKMHQPDEFTPVERPQPAPPAAHRPDRLSATRIETWLKDPYSIYARYILDLKKLKPLEQNIDAAEHGTILHAALKNFVETYKTALPANAEAVFIAMAQEEIKKYHDEPASWAFWQSRLVKLAEKFIRLERNWRGRAHPGAFEASGSIPLKTSNGVFTLTARADRIDHLPGGAAIIDYKSGGQYSVSGIASGRHPQLSLEGLILNHGGFTGFESVKTGYLGYWKLTGSGKDEKPAELDKNLEDAIARAKEGLKNLVSVFSDPSVPYINLPHADQIPRYNDYEHLARVREWSVFGNESADGESEAA